MAGVTVFGWSVGLMLFALILFELCPLQTPPFWAFEVHPLKLHRFLSTIAPCVIQTPPFTAFLAHPLKLHRFVMAPCVMQTPPWTTLLVHPLELHRFLSTNAPCVIQTPPFTAPLAHPLKLHCLLLPILLPLLLCCAMGDTNSPLYSSSGTSLHTARFAVEPCVTVTQTPPFWERLLLPSTMHFFLFVFFFFVFVVAIDRHLTSGRDFLTICIFFSLVLLLEFVSSLASCTRSSDSRSSTSPYRSIYIGDHHLS